MSWIGRMFGRITPKNEIEKYLDECAEYANSLEGKNKSDEFWKLIKQTHEYIENNKFDSNKKDNLGEQRRSEEYANKKILEYFEKTPKEKVLEDWNACQLHILFSGKSFAGLDKRKVSEEMSNAKGCVPKTDNIPPAPKQKLKPFGICTETGMLVFCNDAKDYLTYKEKQPERVPFENFKNNRKKMKKEVRHCERFILTSVEEDGKVSITIEPKKGFDVCNVSLNVVIGELQKEPVFPKELLNPNSELQAQYDTLAKLTTTMDYYNGKKTFMGCDIVTTINENGKLETERYGVTSRKLYFRNHITAVKFLENFLSEIESVKHLI